MLTSLFVTVDGCYKAEVRRLLWWAVVVLLGALQLTTLAAGSLALSVNLGQYFPAHLPKPGPPPPPAASPVEQLRLDIAYLARELPRVYAGGTGFHHGSAAVFRKSAVALGQQLPTLDSGHILVGIMRLLSMLRDGETGLVMPPDLQLPISTTWFGDELRLIGVPADQQVLLGGRVLAIDGTPIAVVRARLRGVIPAVTAWEADATSSFYLRYGRILEGLDITSQVDRATLTVEDLAHHVHRVLIHAEFTRGGDPAGMLHPPATLAGEHADLPYWWRYLPAGNIVYVKYNQCLSGGGFAGIATQAVAAMEEHAGARLVVDLRGNGGGNSAPFAALIHALHQRAALDQPGRIFGLIDRHTFSSATLNAVQLRTQTHALLVGEPTGDPANQWGDQRFLYLTNYLPVHYSTHYFDPAARYHAKPYVTPDLSVPTTLTDLMSGTDAVLNAVLQRASTTPNKG